MTEANNTQTQTPRESIDYDVVIVGAGPAGLSAAIRLKQLAQQKGNDISVCVLEKGSTPGAHILAGTVIDPDALTELIPDWKTKGAPLQQAVLQEQVFMLTSKTFIDIPHMLTPHNLRSDGCYIIGLGSLVTWLAQEAENMGVEIFSGFAANELLYDSQGTVVGVATGNMGVGKDGNPTAHFQPGMEIRAKYTVLSEGSRGQLGRQVIERYKLDTQSDPQSYSIGIKELWEVEDANHRPGTVIHTAGWPLDNQTYGGGFMYHMPENKVALGLVIGLNYSNPWLDPFEEMQRWKTHPAIKTYLRNAKRIGYGARTITAGGLFSLPKFIFPGGVLVGCNAGFLNGSRIKGVHTAIKSGMLASESIFEALSQSQAHTELVSYSQAFQRSWMFTELQQSKNFKQWFKKGLLIGSFMTGVEHLALPFIGVHNPPWSMHNKKQDYEYLRPAAECPQIHYDKPDGELTFDRLSSLYLSNTNHEENQPAHLTLKNPGIVSSINWKIYAGPETRYCPAGVYEYVHKAGETPQLQINAQNCLHCKTCDIKDPRLNIVWVAPEGGGGPNYVDM